MSSGWQSYFDMHYSQQIAPVVTEAQMWAMEQLNSQYYLTYAEYVQCVSDAYNVYHTIVIDAVASYVVIGHLKTADYQTITGQAFSGVTYFELHFSQQVTPPETETQMYACVASGLISDSDYVQCVTDAYVTYKTIAITDLQSYVASGHLTAAQYQTITGQTYSA
jgi:hypothetical protein